MRRDINYRKKPVKNTNTWRLNNTLLNNQEITEEIKEEIKKYLEYTFFSGTCGMFARIDHILGHKTSLYKFKRIEIISSIFSDHNIMKVEINHSKNKKKGGGKECTHGD